MVKIFKTIDLGTIGSGGTVDKSWTADEDYKLVRLVAIEKNDKSLANVTVTARIDDFTFTKDRVPLSYFQDTPKMVIELNYDFTRNKTLYLSVTNNYAETRDIFIVLELEKAG